MLRNELPWQLAYTGHLLFICHASEDKPQVRLLVRRLRDDGFDPWLDEERLLPGQDWQLEISAAVRQSDVVIVCLSATSVAKTGYVQKELRRVLDVAEYQPEGRIFVIPVRLEDCPVPLGLSQWEYADLFVENGYERLREALRARAEGRDVVFSIAPFVTGSIRPVSGKRDSHGRTIVAGIIIIIVAATATLLWRSLRKPKDVALVKPAALPNEEEPPGMVRIAGGRFLMGSNEPADAEASPAHEVTVPPFYLDVKPVTNARFREFLRSSNKVSQSSGAAAGRDDWPVARITWDEADAFCLAQGKRLPSEAEWEFAARGSEGRLYPWGETFDPAAVNSRESGVGHAEPVGSRPLNRSPYGVFDMSGNVWQWCEDEYRPYAGRKAAFAIPDSAKAIRGGSFQSDRLHVTAVTRNLELPSTRSPAIGFRCAK